MKQEGWNRREMEPTPNTKRRAEQSNQGKQPQKTHGQENPRPQAKTNKKERSTGCRQETRRNTKTNENELKSTSAPAQSADRHTSTRAVRICVTSGWPFTCTPARAGSWWRTLLRKLVVSDLPMREHVTVCFICFLSWFTNWCKSFVTCQSRSGRPVQRTQRRGLTLSNLTNTTTLNKLHAAWHRYPSLPSSCLICRKKLSFVVLLGLLSPCFVPLLCPPLGLSSGAFWSSQCSAGPSLWVSGCICDGPVVTAWHLSSLLFMATNMLRVLFRCSFFLHWGIHHWCDLDSSSGRRCMRPSPWPVLLPPSCPCYLPGRPLSCCCWPPPLPAVHCSIAIPLGQPGNQKKHHSPDEWANQIASDPQKGTIHVRSLC